MGIEVKDSVGLVIALVAANWAALGIALKCRDKIDASRNLLWGISGEKSPESEEMIRFIYWDDIIGFSVALVWILCAVGIILIVASCYMRGTDVPGVITGLYAVTGLLMVAGGVVTGILARLSSKKVIEYALNRLQNSQESK